MQDSGCTSASSLGPLFARSHRGDGAAVSRPSVYRTRGSSPTAQKISVQTWHAATQTPTPACVSLVFPPAAAAFLERIATPCLRELRLLTNGELHVVRAFQRLGRDEQILFARLLHRVDRVYWLRELAYPEVADPSSAMNGLIQHGFAWCARRHASPLHVARSCTVLTLRRVCRMLGRPTGGRRSDLIARCSDATARSALVESGFRLRHRALFCRLSRLRTLNFRNDRSGKLTHTPKSPAPPCYSPHVHHQVFKNRSQLRNLEWASTLLAPVPETDPLFEFLEQTARTDDWPDRFTGRRMVSRVLSETLLKQEGRLPPAHASQLWQRLIDCGGDLCGRGSIRLAHALRALDDAAGLQRLLNTQTAQSIDARQLELEGIARRAAHRVGVSHRPLVPRVPVKKRTIHLTTAGTVRNRPHYAVDGKILPVEQATIALLHGHGRVAVRAEHAPWTTLFGVLFRSAIFDGAPAMLPVTGLRCPIDFALPAFRSRREPHIARVLEAIREGRAAEAVAATVDTNGCESIPGVHWGCFPPAALKLLATAVPGPALAGMMEWFLTDWRRAREGLPDLWVLPDCGTPLPEAFPSRLPAESIFVEVKGPGDGLRPAQSVWLDRLTKLGLRAEVWTVTPNKKATQQPDAG